MTDKPAAQTATTTAAATKRLQETSPAQKQILQKRALLAEIGSKWGKFCEQELSDLKSSDDLTAQVTAKYGVEQAVAHRDVTTMLNGRAF